MQSVLIYYPFEMKAIPSAIGIRPAAMTRAFEACGARLEVISGNRSVRQERVTELLKQIDRGAQFDLLYLEIPSMPTLIADPDHVPRHPLLDLHFLAHVRRKGIPIGVFWRDIYWKFPFYFRRLGWMKGTISALLHELDLWGVGRMADVIFVPSLRMAHLFPDRYRSRLKELPPGHDRVAPNSIVAPRSLNDIHFIYAGGITPPNYDIGEVFQIARRFQVTVCCREKEWESAGVYYAQTAGAKVVHVSGHDLSSLYGHSNVSMLVRAHHPYLEFAMPLKLFESLGFGLPILVTSPSAAADFVSDSGIGWTAPGIIDFDFYRIVSEFESKRRRIIGIHGEHHWKERALAVFRSLGVHS